MAKLASPVEHLGAHTTDSNVMLDSSETNYQLFEVCQSRILRLTVKVVRAKGITRGKIKDWLYSPDPYVAVQVLGTPNGQKKTKHIANSCDPEWNEELTFIVDPVRDRLVEFILFDLNRTLNEEIGREIFSFYGYEPAIDHHIVISYKNGSKMEVVIRLDKSPRPDLRMDLELCLKERDFLEHRRKATKQGMCSLLGSHQGPSNEEEVPNICLMTSGGGFRAMIAYAGAYKALYKTGIIDCVTYTASLSGSSWYLSTLYSHPDFPHDPDVIDRVAAEIRTCVEKHWQVHLSPPWSSRYLRKIIGKSVQGQPVSFTDFYGYLVGQQLLKGRMKARLSHQEDKIFCGLAPMPLYTCLHVKSNVSAKVFQEWYEFSPFEVAIPKYGVCFSVQDFSSKFYLGHKVKSFNEVPLHFLYGIWGSAFTILFKRLVQERGRNGQFELIRMIMGKEENKAMVDEEDIIVRCIAAEADFDPGMCSSDDDVQSPRMIKESNNEDSVSLDMEEIKFNDHVEGDSDDQEVWNMTKGVDGCVFQFPSDDTCSGFSSLGSSNSEQEDHSKSIQTRDDSGCIQESGDAQGQQEKFKTKMKQTLSKIPLKMKKTKKTELKSPDEETALDALGLRTRVFEPLSPTALEEDRSRWDRVLERALMSTPLDSRAFRAGVILNPLRGLTFEEKLTDSNLQNLSPVKPTDKTDCEFKGYRESMKTDDKKIYLVDAGLSFNLPFPPVLRPQRGVELYITMDFSSRTSDATPPFRELLLAEKWARIHSIPFPSIREAVKEHLDEPIKECYVFKDPNKPSIPVIIFFPLINRDFRHFSKPGKARSKEELAFGDFSIFDETTAYAIWRFVYPNLSFDRMTAMMEFNILNNLDVIKREMAYIVERKRAN